MYASRIKSFVVTFPNQYAEKCNNHSISITKPGTKTVTFDFDGCCLRDDFAAMKLHVLLGSALCGGFNTSLIIANSGHDDRITLSVIRRAVQNVHDNFANAQACVTFEASILEINEGSSIIDLQQPGWSVNNLSVLMSTESRRTHNQIYESLNELMTGIENALQRRSFLIHLKSCSINDTAASASRFCEPAIVGPSGAVFVSIAIQYSVSSASKVEVILKRSSMFTVALLPSAETFSFRPKGNDSILIIPRNELQNQYRSENDEQKRVVSRIGNLQAGSKALSTLTRVVHSLIKNHHGSTTPDKRPVHVPYRDAMLTRFMKPCFQNNFAPFMLTLIAGNEDSNMNSLRFAAEMGSLRVSVTPMPFIYMTPIKIPMTTRDLTNKDGASSTRDEPTLVSALNSCEEEHDSTTTNGNSILVSQDLQDCNLFTDVDQVHENVAQSLLQWRSADGVDIEGLRRLVARASQLLELVVIGTIIDGRDCFDIQSTDVVASHDYFTLVEAANGQMVDADSPNLQAASDADGDRDDLICEAVEEIREFQKCDIVSSTISPKLNLASKPLPAVVGGNQYLSRVQSNRPSRSSSTKDANASSSNKPQRTGIGAPDAVSSRIATRRTTTALLARNSPIANETTDMPSTSMKVSPGTIMKSTVPPSSVSQTDVLGRAQAIQSLNRQQLTSAQKPMKPVSISASVSASSMELSSSIDLDRTNSMGNNGERRSNSDFIGLPKTADVKLSVEVEIAIIPKATSHESCSQCISEYNGPAMVPIVTPCITADYANATAYDCNLATFDDVDEETFSELPSAISFDSISCDKNIVSGSTSIFNPSQNPKPVSFGQFPLLSEVAAASSIAQTSCQPSHKTSELLSTKDFPLRPVLPRLKGSSKQVDNQQEDSGDNLTPTEKEFLRRVASSRVDEAKTSIQNGVNVEVCNAFGRTAMQIAARNGCLPMLEMLHRYGGDLWTRGKRGETLLHLAANNGHVDAIAWLHRAGIPKDVVDIVGQTLVHVAVRRLELGVLQYLHFDLHLNFSQADFEDHLPIQLLPRSGPEEDIANCRKFVEFVLRETDASSVF